MSQDNEIKDLEEQQKELEGSKDEQSKAGNKSLDVVKADLAAKDGDVKVSDKEQPKNKEDIPKNEVDKVSESSLEKSTMREKLSIIKDELTINKSVSIKKGDELKKSSVKDIVDADEGMAITNKQPEPTKRDKAFQELAAEVKQTIIDIHKKLLGLKDKLGVTGIAQAVIKAGELSNALSETLNIIRWNPKNSIMYAVEFGKGMNTLKNFSKSLDTIKKNQMATQNKKKVV